MSVRNGKFKHRGPKSKKGQRKIAADARAKSWATLTSEQKIQVAEQNKTEYKYWHDNEQHLNGGEREFKRTAGLPLHS